MKAALLCHVSKLKVWHHAWIGTPLICLIIAASQLSAAGQIVPHGVPWEFSSARYTVKVNGQAVPVFLSAMNLHFASFDMSAEADVEVTINDNDYNRHDGLKYPTASEFWGAGACLRPASSGCIAKTEGRKATFTLTRPGQYCVDRTGPSDFRDEALFIFANPPEAITSKTDKEVIRLEAGIHHRNIDLRSGQTLYLAAGAVLFGAINIWNAEDVRICGRGVIVYDGPNARSFDSGWMVRPNWHPVTTRNVRGLTLEGVTFVNRSRTWSLQFTRTFDADFDNIKIIASCPENLNADGMDWYGGGRAKVRNSFIRCADDCFAFHTEDASMALRVDRGGGGTLPGAPHKATPVTTGKFTDLTIENCVLWPTVANVMRAGWSNQNLSTSRISMRNCDVIRMETPLRSWLGADWAIFTAVQPSGDGVCLHEDYVFEDIRVETPVALLGVNWPRSRLKNFLLKDIRIAGRAGQSLLACSAEEIRFQNIVIDGRKAQTEADLRLSVRRPDGETSGIVIAE